MKSTIVLLFLTLMLCSGCAGLMMGVKEMDDKSGNIILQNDAPVQVASPAVDVVIEDATEGKEFSAALRAKILEQLKDKGVAVSDSATQKIVVKITNYDKGCGFCRGFFPVFGLGDSYLDGEATLETADGNRTLVITKRGQTRGMAAMGDQTDDNMEYFAKVLVKNFMKNAGDEDEEKEEEE